MLHLVNEIWERRSLLLTLAINDLKLRYKKSVLGFFWTFLEPLLLLSVLYLVFSNIFKSDIMHYPLFLLMGLILWNMFSRGTSMSMDNLLHKAGLVSQTYLPREILIISSVLTSFFMLCFELIVFFIFVGAFGIIPSINIVFFPVMLGILFLMTLGVSFGLSALNVYYRDVKTIWTVLLQAGFFLSPIIYSIEIFPENIKNIISLNPFVPLLNISRDVVIYNKWPESESFSYLIFILLVVLVSSYLIFKKLDKRLVEEL